jgi:GxxExxY protein
MGVYYKTESYEIVGAAMHVYNVLGTGFVEAVYQEALEIEFQRRNIPYEREKEIDVYYDGVLLKKKFQPDFVCYGKIIVELKAVMDLDDQNRVQVYNYLRATNMKLGLLLNFGHPDELEYERKVI